MGHSLSALLTAGDELRAEQSPEFRLMAEVYRDLEWTLQQQGFDFTSDNRLYDRLRAGHAHPIREHIYAGVDYQNKLARFLENHDEIPGSFHICPGYPRSHRDREFSVFWFGFLPSRTLFG
jgi:hypothetical protein